ncbi:hypothetical protein BH18PSE1_BH18PSE1_05420 [soil metagenome]
MGGGGTGLSYSAPFRWGITTFLCNTSQTRMTHCPYPGPFRGEPGGESTEGFPVIPAVRDMILTSERGIVTRNIAHLRYAQAGRNPAHDVGIVGAAALLRFEKL